MKDFIGILSLLIFSNKNCAVSTLLDKSTSLRFFVHRLAAMAAPAKCIIQSKFLNVSSSFSAFDGSHK